MILVDARIDNPDLDARARLRLLRRPRSMPPGHSSDRARDRASGRALPTRHHVLHARNARAAAPRSRASRETNTAFTRICVAPGDRAPAALQLRDHAGLRRRESLRACACASLTPKGHARLDLSSYRRVFQNHRILRQTAARLAKRCKSQHQKTQRLVS